MQREVKNIVSRVTSFGSKHLSELELKGMFLVKLQQGLNYYNVHIANGNTSRHLSDIELKGMFLVKLQPRLILKYFYVHIANTSRHISDIELKGMLTACNNVHLAYPYLECKVS